MRILAVLVACGALAGALGACNETPSYFPPCVDPNADPCAPLDGGVDGGDADAEGGKKASLDSSSRRVVLQLAYKVG
jgi:hypothetical protein